MTTVNHLKQINILFHFTFEWRLKEEGRLLILPSFLHVSVAIDPQLHILLQAPR